MGVVLAWDSNWRKKQVYLNQVLPVMLTKHTHARARVRILKISYCFSVGACLAAMFYLF